jgi:TonB family protein
MSRNADKNVPISITLQTKGGKTEALEFSQESIIIGSGGSAHVRLKDDEVSSHHAMVKVKSDGRVVVMDLGSDSGTMMDGNEVEGEAELADGAQVKVGDSTLTVHFGGHVSTDTTAPLRPGEDGSPKRKSAAEEATDPFHEVAHKEAVEAAKGGKKKGAPPPPKSKKAPKPVVSAATPAPSGISELGRRLLEEDLPAEERPTEGNRMLEVALLWKDTVIEVRHGKVGDAVTLGTDAKATFKMSTEGWGPDPASLVTTAGHTVVLVPEAGEVKVRAGGETLTREDLKKSGRLARSDGAAACSLLKLELGDRAAVTLGEITFIVQWVARAKVATLPPWKTVDYYFQKILVGTVAAHVLLLFMFHLTPVDPDALTDDLFKNPQMFTKLLLKPQELEKKTKKDDLSGKKGGAKHKDKEGKFGKKETKQKEAASSKKGAPVVDPNKREKDRAIAFNAGVLGILKKEGGAVSNVFGPGGLGTGINNALGGLNGTSMGDAGGAGGLGTRGTGPGGGGNALGIGGLGSGTGRGSGGQGEVDLGGRGKGSTKITPGKTIVEGSLSKEEIGRVIRRYLSQIKYCYEKELTRNPNLAGKVVVGFTIGGTGKVTESNVVETSLNDQTVEDCVLKIINRIQFPQPKGGGIVLVTYPFIFQASGN